MADFTTLVIWISKGDSDIDSYINAALESCKKAGLNVKWLNCLSGLEVAEKLSSAGVSHLTRTVILSAEEDAAWNADLVRSVKVHGNPHVANSLIFWGFRRPESATIESIITTGVDDIFSLASAEKELPLRIRVRVKDLLYRDKIAEQLKTQLATIAKSETTLRQREEFLSVCAHDLRSPLGLVQSSIAMLLNSEKNRENLTPFQVDLLTRVRRQATQGLGLVKDLLDVMSFEQGLKPHYQLIQLHEVLSEFHNDYRFQAEQAGVTFHYKNSITAWRVLADADRVRQLLQNLVTNAIKFTDQGKNIYLDVSPFTGRRKSDPPYPMVVISIKDEGRGIPKKEMQKIFDRFTQLKDHSRAQGRGLGLTVAKQISTLHDGNIWVTSEEGKGSTFFVLIPHTISKLDYVVEKHVKPRVLVVDGTFDNRALFYDKISEWGYEPVYARDGVEAIASVYHYSPDLLLLTKDIKKLNETELANFLRTEKATSEIPLLMARDLRTGAGSVAQDSDILFDTALPLPFTREEFHNAVLVARRDHRLKNNKKSAA